MEGRALVLPTLGSFFLGWLSPHLYSIYTCSLPAPQSRAHVDRCLLDDIRNDLQDLLGDFPNAFVVLRDRLPNRRMVGLGSHTPIDCLLASFLRLMLLLGLQPPSPLNVSEIAVLRQPRDRTTLGPSRPCVRTRRIVSIRDRIGALL